MRVTMAEKRVLIKSFAPRYRRKRKKVKGEVLTEFTQMTGYNRCYVLVVWKLGRIGRPRSLGEGRSRSRRGYPNSAIDSTNRTRSTCREIGNLW